jgi:hypothetical protein
MHWLWLLAIDMVGSHKLRMAAMEGLGPVDKPNPDPNGCKDDKGREALKEFIVARCATRREFFKRLKNRSMRLRSP